MPEHYINPAKPKIRFSLLECIAIGFGAGVVGVAAMTLAEKAEQAITHRPNSEVPGKTLARLLNGDFHSAPTTWNWSMHWGQGILAAGIRGLMSYSGIVGPFGSFLFMGVRLCIDQTLENLTGVGALPWTWPVHEQIIDLMHKAIFAAVTGYVADRMIVGEALNA
ncbi:hypothetical protein LTR99_008250 [Exophiala xenobiotica]|uniref:DUF1440 domain-containing protein n=2 Tax=leotiomyceta TaxID=716546 RepID=A0A0D2CJ81_9EURO|nr:uncharacterized protein PV05_11542 [Exophiala xenobiotica]KAK5528398.1 hypothetical protein LTR25_010397 [Vermiconidia calcicola]KAK5539344.1 hypothetical protein LTR23_006565 [Chaetothyriales sp. CCFEE 6169]KAJ9496143.1 hypothetical protein H2202_008389 [Exophiala xenobiotica]KAK5198605.1 hypothetical protein LTR92_001076 [Exophiala xenobiotica]KAK5205683.1 hypothetical protein LTR41_008751 [Exophiala xenobiotica]